MHRPLKLTQSYDAGFFNSKGSFTRDFKCLESVISFRPSYSLSYYIRSYPGGPIWVVHYTKVERKTGASSTARAIASALYLFAGDLARKAQIPAPSPISLPPVRQRSATVRARTTTDPKHWHDRASLTARAGRDNGRRQIPRDHGAASAALCLSRTLTTFAIGWKGRYRIEGPAFIYVDHDTGQLSTILGYPTHQLK